MQITPKARLISLIVALVFMAGTLIGSGTYLIINHINNANATTQTTLSVSGNLYNTNGTINTSAVTDFLNKLDFVTSGGTYTSPQIADNAGVTATNSFIFQMGYYVSPSGAMTTSKPITWQAVYAQNGYLTIWMTQNYTVSFFNAGTTTIATGNNPFAPYTTAAGNKPSYVTNNSNYSASILRDTNKKIYNLIADELPSFDTIIVSPDIAADYPNATQDSDNWQYEQDDTYPYDIWYGHHNGLGIETSSYNWSSSTTTTWSSCMDDKFWAPSQYEIFNTEAGQSNYSQENGLWGLSVTDRTPNPVRLDTNTSTSSSSTGYSNYCWLRSGNSFNYNNAMQVNSSGSASGNSVSYGYGVRPAAHLSLSALEDAAKPSYTISVTPNNQTYGTVSTNGGTYIEGSTLSVTATPNPHYQFVRWERNGVQVSTSLTYEITVSGNDTYTAIFEPIRYTITITTNSENYGKILYNNSLITSTQVIQDSGTQISNLYAISSASYAFLYWLDSATGQRYTANPLTYTVSADSTLTAIFGSSMADGVAVCVESLEGATAAIGEARITGYSNIDGVDYVHFSAVAYTGYKFLGWYIMGEETPISTDLSTDLALSQVQNKIIIARFTPIENQNDMNDETDNGQTDDFVFF